MNNLLGFIKFWTFKISPCAPHKICYTAQVLEHFENYANRRFLMKSPLLTAGIVLTLSLGNAWAAGPYTTSLNNDVYAGANNGIPTPNDQTDEGDLGGTQLYHVFNQLTGSSFTQNSDLDSYQFTGNDNIWKDNGGFFSLISVSASNFNTLNIYDTTNPSTKYDIFGGSVAGNAITGNGSDSDPYLPASDSPLAPGTTFGFSLASFADWDSDPTLNPGGLDHMLTYDLTFLKGQKASFLFTDGETREVTFRNPYLIAFEDLPEGAQIAGRLGDEDFNDNVYLVDGVAPIGLTAVPEPISTVLFLTGGAAMAGGLIRRKMLAKA